MTMATPYDPAVLERLRVLIVEALALSDAQQLHATGIALDTARLEVETALAQTSGPGSASIASARAVDTVRNGATSRGCG